MSKRSCSIDGCVRTHQARGYCAPHYSDWHRQQLKYTIVCHCGKTAKVARKKTKHCSYKCGIDAVNAAKAGMSVSDWQDACPEGGRRKGRLTRLQKGQRKAQRSAEGTRGRTIWVTRTCKLCPNTFTVKSSSPDRCCSETCTKRNKREIFYRKAARRRARKREVFVESVDRLVVFKRDNFICYLCKRKTNLYPNKHYHPRKATIDHVIPLAAGSSAGAEHSYANCRTACYECNASKSDRGGGEQLWLAV